MMSLETKIEELTIAIGALTAVMSNQPQSQPVTEAEEERMQTTGPIEEEEVSEVDASAMRQLAKQKIKDGADRKAIKKLITDLGGETISDLDTSALAKLQKKLEAL